MALETSDPTAVREAARQILSQSQFEDHDPSWWRQVLYYLTHPLELLGEVLDWVAGQFVGTGVGTVVAWLAVVVVATSAVVLIVLLTRSTSHNNVVSFGVPSDSRLQSWSELIAEAERCEGNGEWRMAIRMRYAALLTELGNAGLIRLRPGRTTGEYLDEASVNMPSIAQPLTEVTLAFERAWYGDSAPSAEDVSAFKVSVAKVDTRTGTAA